LSKSQCERNIKIAEMAIESYCGIRNNGRMNVDWIREGLKSAGKTQKELAEFIGLDGSAVTRIMSGERQLKANEAEKIRAFLGQAESAAGQKPAAQPPSDIRPDVLPGLRQFELPRDVPVLGVAVAGDDGEFTLNGQASDYLRRPPGLAFVRTAFAVIVNSTSMEPWASPGDPLFVNPSRPARIGDHVIVECHGDTEGAAGPAYVKKLIKRTGVKIVLEQYNPSRSDIEIDLARVKNIFRIVPLSELIGL